MDRTLAIMVFIAVSTLVDDAICCLPAGGRASRQASPSCPCTGCVSRSAPEAAAIVAAGGPPKDPNQELKHRWCGRFYTKTRGRIGILMMRDIIGRSAVGVGPAGAGRD